MGVLTIANNHSDAMYPIAPLPICVRFRTEKIFSTK